MPTVIGRFFIPGSYVETVGLVQPGGSSGPNGLERPVACVGGLSFYLPDGSTIVVRQDYLRATMHSTSAGTFDLMLVEMRPGGPERAGGSTGLAQLVRPGGSYSYGHFDAAGLPVVLFSAFIYPDVLPVPLPMSVPAPVPLRLLRDQSGPLAAASRRDDDRRDYRRERSRSRDRGNDRRRRSRSRSRERSRERPRERSRERREPSWEPLTLRNTPRPDFPRFYDHSHNELKYTLREFIGANDDRDLTLVVKDKTLYLKNSRGYLCDATYWYLVRDGALSETLKNVAKQLAGSVYNNELYMYRKSCSFLGTCILTNRSPQEMLDDPCTDQSCTQWRHKKNDCKKYHPGVTPTLREIMRFYNAFTPRQMEFICRHFPKEVLDWFKNESGMRL